ncbi:MAG TPA: hypothetical protein VM925_26850 [Labilithrix sp.]|nr:hypothetical protein [Labilithrix sp.]
MGQCNTCGNDYDKTFEVLKDGETFTFDCFECAIHRLAPECAHCGCRVVGHGVEEGVSIYCGASCARSMGRTTLRDRGDLGSVELPGIPGRSP